MAQENHGFTASSTDIPLGLRLADQPAAPEHPVVVATVNGKDHLVRGDQKHKDPEAEDYDPHDHQDVAHPMSNTDTLFHLLKGCIGSGILAMPEAFKHAGYVVGTLGTVIIGIICTTAVHMLVNAEYELSRRRRVPTLSYPEAAEAALHDGPPQMRWSAKYMKALVNIFVVANQMGACIAYILFVATNIQAIVEHFCHPGLNLHLYMVFVTIPLILQSWLRDLKYLAPLSTAAMSVTLGSFAVILYYVFRTVPTISDKHPAGSVADFPLFFGTALFSLEAMGVMMTLKNEMRTPAAFGGTFGVLNRAMVPIVVLFTCVGLFGYLQYGDNVVATITLNLPQEEILAQCVRLMMALAIFVSHGLMNYPNFEAIWINTLLPRCESRKVSPKLQIFYEYLVRTAIVLFHFTVAAIFDDLGLVISLVGALCLSMIGLAFPAIVHMSTFWYSCASRRNFIVMIIKDSLILILGFIALVIGTYTAVKDKISK